MTGASPPGSHPDGRRPALVLAGGEMPARGVLPPLDGDALVVAADSGVDQAAALGLRVDLVVGDLDSASPTALDAARSDGAAFETYPAAKNATDLELALHAARALGAHRITVLGGGGGRHDHLLGNALVLASPALADVEVDALVGTAHITVIRDATTLHGAIGSLCSLIPVGGVAHAVRTDGLRFPLRDEDLHPGTTRGISNELEVNAPTVSLRDGVLLAVQPHALEEI